MIGICDKCKKKGEGDIGTFFYGKQINKEIDCKTKTSLLGTKIIRESKVTYQILGNKNVFICNTCLEKRIQKKRIAWSITSFVSLILSVIVILNWLKSPVIFSIVFAIVFVIFIGGLITLFEKKKDTLDQFAINVAKGYKLGKCWTTSDFKKLKQ